MVFFVDVLLGVFRMWGVFPENCVSPGDGAGELAGVLTVSELALFAGGLG
jgi:hypothetical protein